VPPVGVDNGFVNYDDDRLREELATKGPWEIATGAFYYAYKPVYGLWLWAERALFGDTAKPGLVASWLLFGVAVGLTAVVLNRMLRSVFLAVAAAALLATHPVHAENVAWWAERKDVLSLVLVLLAHLAHQRASATRCDVATPAAQRSSRASRRAPRGSRRRMRSTRWSSWTAPPVAAARAVLLVAVAGVVVDA
jgi:hypothetical protein